MYTEEEIQDVLEDLEKTHPDRATREYAIQTLDKMGVFANMIIDRILEEKESGRLKFTKDGKIYLNGKLIKRVKRIQKNGK